MVSSGLGWSGESSVAIRLNNRKDSQGKNKVLPEWKRDCLPIFSFDTVEYKLTSKLSMDDTTASLESLELDARKIITDKELITTAQLQSSLRANLEEIKKELAVTADEMKVEIKQEINLLAGKLQKFEDQVNEMDFCVKNLKDECGKSQRRMLDLELKQKTQNQS
ncbi:Hypothetical predicted protein [Pelobates cultripes]|uniref:Uncharacterized protein n=1 Tax=Pelobates cultripes TaxID=61616 RepID=A0AAD1WD98_PELCU|nr:Hypothetical predicted protein [Pelobates cultripes]